MDEQIATKTFQQEQIMALLEERGSITNRDCYDMGINSPTKRISELRAKGFPIADKQETGKNRFGVQSRYKRYYLEDGA